MKYILTCLLFYSATATMAQVQDPDSGMPSQMAGVLNFPKQFFFFDITQNGWLNAPEGVATKFISGGLNINFLNQFNVIGSSVAIAPGLSYSVASVKSNSVFEYDFSDDQLEVIYTNVVPDTVFEKSKLSVSHIEIPVEIHFRIKAGERGRNFLIGPGFRAGIEVGNFWKIKPQGTVPTFSKAKIYDVPNVSPFRYGVSLRLMYYKFGLFGYYQLNHLFEKGKGPAITPFSVGVTVSPF